MPRTVLVTGGAGFIGSHLSDELLAHGYRVRALDCLNPQVHGDEARDPSFRPSYLHDEVELIRGDIRCRRDVDRAVRGADAVVHFAASVGVGQSMYEVAGYTAVNSYGTGVLLEALAEHPVERLVVASSMSIYGEGMYAAASGDALTREVGTRGRGQLERRQWEVMDEHGEELHPLPTPESKTADPTSVYALSKYDQERLCLMVGEAYGIPTSALRFFNVYGTRQALSNPYTGVLAIFASRYLNDQPPLIFEDGHQQRDFVSVRDVAKGTRLALERAEAAGEAFNIGSGQPHSVLEIADMLAGVLDRRHLEPHVVGKYRVGDIRHCFADISKARRLLGYEPRVDLRDGLEELAAWLEGQTAQDHADRAGLELHARGLTV